MKELGKTAELVMEIMKQKPATRDDDHLLYLEVLKVYEFQHDVIILHQSLERFLSTVNLYGCPKFETVGRCRRKVQELHPELRSAEPVAAARGELIGEFRAFAQEGEV